MKNICVSIINKNKNRIPYSNDNYSVFGNVQGTTWYKAKLSILRLQLIFRFQDKNLPISSVDCNMYREQAHRLNKEKKKRKADETPPSWLRFYQRHFTVHDMNSKLLKILKLVGSPRKFSIFSALFHFLFTIPAAWVWFFFFLFFSSFVSCLDVVMLVCAFYDTVRGYG